MTPGPNTFWNLSWRSTLVLAATSCAQVLGLEDPNGRLEDGVGGASQAGTGSASTEPAGSTGAAQPTGGGGGSTSVTATGSTGAGSAGGAGGDASSTGGGPASGGVVELEPGLTFQALGPAPGGASILVRADVATTFCVDAELPVATLAAAQLSTGACDFLGAIDVALPLPDTEPVAASTVAVRGSAVAVSGTASTGTQLSLAEDSLAMPNGGRMGFGAWWRTDGADRRLGASTQAVTATAAFPREGDAERFVFQSIGGGLTLTEPPPSCGDVALGQGRVFAVDIEAESCIGPTVVTAGELLAAVADESRSLLIRMPGSQCVVAVDGEQPNLGGCGPSGSIFARDIDGLEVYASVSLSQRCADQRNPGYGIIRAKPAPVSTVACEGRAATTSMRIFHVSEAEVWFARTEVGLAEIVAVPKDGSGVEQRFPVCQSCDLRGIVESDGIVYFAGVTPTQGEATVLGRPVANDRSFWAWIPLAEL